MSGPALLDLRGLKCPLPVLRTRRALRAMPPGAELLVSCTDPMAAIDIPHMARGDGHALIDSGTAGPVTWFRLARGPLVTPAA